MFWLVATVLTVYGIETLARNLFVKKQAVVLQQSLPFTVLKREAGKVGEDAYNFTLLQQSLPFTVLKHIHQFLSSNLRHVKLQQSLPFTVLKLKLTIYYTLVFRKVLQQSLPFTVLKR